MIPIPERMRHLPLHRGMPVPMIALWTDSGEPLFACNDEVKRQHVISQDLCHICGGKLQRGRWFTGGTLSVCATHGLNLDSGMHDECIHYSLKVCPYLAAPKYGRLVGEQQMLAKQPGRMIIQTGTETNSRPDLFVAVMAVDQELRRGALVPGLPEEIVYGVRPKLGSVRKAELWRHGNRLQPTPMITREIELACKAAGDTMRRDVRRLLP